MFDMYRAEIPTYLRRRGREDHRIYGCLAWRTLDLLLDYYARTASKEIVWR